MKDIIQQYKYKIRQIIKNYTGSFDDDIEQEVYIRTYKNLSKYSEQNKFSQWIYTITSNICKDYLRSSRYNLQKNTVSDVDCLNSIKTTKTPEREYSLLEQQRLTLRAINNLPSKLKEAIVLYEFEDYSYEQISQKLKVPVGTVKSRLNSARKILKEELRFLIGDEYE